MVAYAVEDRGTSSGPGRRCRAKGIGADLCHFIEIWIIGSAGLPGPVDVRIDAEGADHARVQAYESAIAVQECLTQVPPELEGRLELLELRLQSEDMTRALKRAQEAEMLRVGGLERPPDAPEPELGWPGPDEVHVWRDLCDLADFRVIAERRDHAARAAAELARPGREPVRWRVTPPEANGIFRARRTDDHITDEPFGERDGDVGVPRESADQVEVVGWCETYETVTEALRGWSQGGLADVRWTGTPSRPPRRRPTSGWLPDHPGNVDGLAGLGAVLDMHAAWRAQLPGVRATLIETIEGLRTAWGSDDVRARLEAAAIRLNAEEPQAPSLGGLVRGGGRNGEVLSVSRAARWIDPALVACTGTPTWNDFGDHRPDQTASLARALVEDDIEELIGSLWWLARDCIALDLVPGPAGPLYELGVNGTHRVHAARLVGLPLLFAELTYYPLPTAVAAGDVARHGEFAYLAARESEACWSALRDRGLLVGEIHTDGPGAVTLHPDWVLAPWLLARSEVAVGWAANYDRAFPGALAKAGIPTEARRSATAWRDWLGLRPDAKAGQGHQ